MRGFESDFRHVLQRFTAIFSLSFLLFLPVACSEPGRPVNGNRRLPINLVVGSRVTYSCNEGYLLVGSEVRACGDNGQLSGQQPTCQSKLW